MKYIKKHLLTIVGIGALILTVGLNLRNAVNNYGILDNSLSIEVLAQTGSSGGGSDSGGESSGGGSSDNSGNSGGSGSTTVIKHKLECGSSGVKMCKGTCGIHQVTLENYGDGKSSTFSCTTETTED
jgi:hypothetical protein